MKKIKLGINVLAFVALLLMIYAMTQPWWMFQLEGSPLTKVYPYLIDGPGSEFIGYRRSPQMEILTGVLGICIVIAAAGVLLSGRISRILLGFSGTVIVLGTWRLLSRLAGVAARFEIPLQGEGIATYDGFANINVWTRLGLGTYLMLAGALLVFLGAGLHDRVRLGN
jgi:hypothetical protein